MRILQLCHKPPRPALDGGCLAMDALTTGLLDSGARVKVLTASTRKHPLSPEILEPDYLDKTDLEGVAIETDLDVRDAYVSLLNGVSYNISRFYSHQYAMVLKKVLSRERFDVVHLESLYTTPYIETIRNHAPTALIAMRSHNHEYQLWEQRWKAAKNPIHRLILRHLSRTLERYEKSVMSDLDAIVAISSAEGMGYRNWGFTGPIHVSGFGLPLEGEEPAPDHIQPSPSQGIRLFHLGAMDWGPNREGVEWFIREVWPAIRAVHPKTEFHIGGRGLSKSDWTDVAGVVNHGEVVDARAFGMQFDMLVVPLLRGAGIRVKIVESLSRGIPVAATDIALRGLELANPDCVIQSSPDGLAQSITQALEKPDKLKDLSLRGWEAARETFNSNRIGAELLKFYGKHVR